MTRQWHSIRAGPLFIFLIMIVTKALSPIADSKLSSAYLERMAIQQMTKVAEMSRFY